MISLEEAKQRILAATTPLSTESVPILDASNRFAAELVTSRIDLPLFDNSAMDGFAVIAEDLRGASGGKPVRLRVVGRIGAGERYQGLITPGTCLRLFTGSVLPSGADAVVMQEDVTIEPDFAVFSEPSRPFENVRLRGEDVRSGVELLQAGDRVNAVRAGLITATGTAEILVHKAPRVALLSTGDELVEPGQPLTEGKIFESNRTLLAMLLRELGCSVSIFPLVPDKLGATVEMLQAAFAGHDAVITTGGVSVGEFDFVKAAFQKLGGEIDHWKVAIRPGKPFVYGRIRSDGVRHLFGLPGNPVSALVTFLVLVRPALLRMAGAREVELPRVGGVLLDRAVNRGDRRHFMRVRLEQGNVRVLGTQASHMLGSIGNANGLLEVPPETTLEPGAAVSVQLWQLPDR